MLEWKWKQTMMMMRIMMYNDDVGDSDDEY